MRFIKYAVLAIIMFASFASRGEEYIIHRRQSWDGEHVSIEKKTYKQPKERKCRYDSGCYIATAVYGSYDCPQVWTLRRYRDDTLASTFGGRCFIHTYYAVSPTLVRLFGKSDWFVNTSKGILDEMVQRLNKSGVSDQPYADKQW